MKHHLTTIAGAAALALAGCGAGPPHPAHPIAEAPPPYASTQPTPPQPQPSHPIVVPHPIAGLGWLHERTPYANGWKYIWLASCQGHLGPDCEPHPAHPIVEPE